MIIGLSHVGLTVSAPDPAVEFYRDRFHCAIVSDAERKGEFAERITGIPGIHTRNIYLSVGPKQHLEVFGFYHPPVIPALREKEFRAGILYVAFMSDRQDRIADAPAGAGKPGCPEAFQPFPEYPFEQSRVVTQADPDGLVIRTVAPGMNNIIEPGFSGTRLLYPALITGDIQSSLDFFIGVLGLTAGSEGVQPWAAGPGSSQDKSGSARWTLLTSPGGSPCLKLAQPLNSKVHPAGPWEMQRVGFTHFALGVRDIDSCYASLLKKGAHFQSPPQSATVGPHVGGKGVYLRTPEGMVVELTDSPLTRGQIENGR